MATVKYANRVKETTASTGTGAVTLGGAVATFQSFADGGLDLADIPYTILDANGNWEVGKGSRSGTTFTRTTIYESSNAGNPINLSGVAEIWNDLPAKYADGVPRGIDGALQLNDDTNEDFLGDPNLWYDVLNFVLHAPALQGCTYELSLNTLIGTKALFDAALADDNFVYSNDIQSITNKTVNGVVLNDGGVSTNYLGEDGTYHTVKAAGVDGQIQFNAATERAGSADFTWDDSGKTLIVLGDQVVTKGLQVGQKDDGVDYEAIVIGSNTEAGGLINFSRAGANNPFVGVAGFDNGTTQRIVQIGGGGWNEVDATDVSIYVASNYDETVDQGVPRAAFRGSGGVELYAGADDAIIINNNISATPTVPVLQIKDDISQTFATLGAVGRANPTLYMKDFTGGTAEWQTKVDGANNRIDFEVITDSAARFIINSVNIFTLTDSQLTHHKHVFYDQTADPTVPADTASIYNSTSNDLTFEDKVTGRKTLAELIAGGATPVVP